MKTEEALQRVTQYWLEEFQKSLAELEKQERTRFVELQMAAVKSQIEDLEKELYEQ